MADSTDIEFMRRAIRLAMNGRGSVEPNPMVGCIIVSGGKIIGEAYHQKFGGPHAEVLALSACTESPAGATAYLTLEPCCHLKKKTPPCVGRLIAARLARVVVGCVDPNPMVSGRGIEELRRTGIEVELDVLCPESRQLNAAFFKQMEQRRPYVTLKWAQTADARIAGPHGERLSISNPASLKVMHAQRARCDAIMVGIDTLLTDDPLLTARGPALKKSPIRIVLDTNLRMPPTSQLARSVGDGPVLVFCGPAVYREKPTAVAELNARGVEVRTLNTDQSGRISLTTFLDELGGRNISHLLVEPGPKLAESFFKENLADRVWVFRSPKRGADAGGPIAPAIHFPAIGTVLLDGDLFTEYLNPNSAAFFARTPSADLVLAQE